MPLPNTNRNGAAYKAGITEFDCGACPECLRKRSSVWALRAYYEAKEHVFSCSVCLTYDQYIRDTRTGKIIGERVASEMTVNKRDIQLFMKRVRKLFGKDIKYICSSEYGKRTHRPHYHVILFGVRFPDCHFYKMSNRGNPIYKSATLDRLWKHGICTVDALNVTPAVARYCTKYAVKGRGNDTFMLCSQHVGLKGLIENFNGIDYVENGTRHPIPRAVWQEIILRDCQKEFDEYENLYGLRPTYKYTSKFDNVNFLARSYYREIRDSYPLYQKYIAYWKQYSDNHPKPSPVERVFALDTRKFYSYRRAWFSAYILRMQDFPALAPGSRVGASLLMRWRDDHRCHLPLWSCRITASDTIDNRMRKKGFKVCQDHGYNPFDNPKLFEKSSSKQLTFENGCDIMTLLNQ
ncbi:replication initiator protein [Dipodfec virus UOA04_Rod_765]|nr:replication initiator protein [Dipodfec virus UOA04_Rod_765]